jgi:hypothetical protein
MNAAAIRQVVELFQRMIEPRREDEVRQKAYFYARLEWYAAELGDTKIMVG